MDGFNPGCGGEREMNDKGVRFKHKSNKGVCFKHKSDGPKRLHGSRDCSTRLPHEVGCHLRIPKSEPVGRTSAEQVVPNPGHVQTSNGIFYTTLPGCCLTKEQDKKVQEIACTRKPETPLFVAAMNKRNVNLKDFCVYIPSQLVSNHFKDKRTKATIQLEAPDNGIYSVGASRHNDDQVVLDSGWDTFVASHHIQEKDLLIFRCTEKSRLEVIILDPSGHEKNRSCPGTGNPSSSTQETSGDSVHSVDPPPREVIDLSSSDDDDIVREGTEESCRAQKWITRSCAKTQKIASTSSPSAKSGHSGPGARKPRDRACGKLEVGSKPLPKNLEGPSQRPYILPQRITPPRQVVQKIEEKVQEIRSELPIFVKVMTTSSSDGTGCRAFQMVFCLKYAEACLPDKRQKLFLQLEGKRKLWETTLVVRRHGQKKERHIAQGWKEFSMQNGLDVGDICLFKLEDTNTRSLKMTVYLIRRSQIEL